MSKTSELLFDYLKNVFYGNKDAELNLEALDEDFTDVGKALVYFTHCYSECRTFASTLAAGNLEAAIPSEKNEMAASLKSLHAGLKHLTWQAQQVAKGDYSQRVDFMGAFSDAFNTMIEQLSERHHKLEELVHIKTRTVVELQNAVLKTMAELVESRDYVTGGHIERTQSYLQILIDALQSTGLYADAITDWNFEHVLQSAQLHDVGKVAIDDAILRKPGDLTQEEHEKIKTHTIFGEEIIERIKLSTSEHSFLEHARIFASTHHEKWNGSGYPKGLKDMEIPLQGRLMAIADVYDALVSVRPYKKAFSHIEAVAIITKDSGSHFDPALVTIFLSVADKFHEVAVRYTTHDSALR
ncbi:MAG: HD domain-containing protein [Treponema sp.]|nr:HD domain-containing protein [Treponema sp.]